jgi:plastocyanin
MRSHLMKGEGMRRSLMAAAAFVALLAAVVLVGCSATVAPSGGSSSTGTPKTTAQVTLRNIAIQPATVTIAVGGTVTWVNQDPMTHNLADDAGNWGSGPMASGKSYSHQFSKAGTFPYHCTIHPSMTGEIVVK